MASEPLGEFGTLSQLNSGVTGTDALRKNSCVPTAVANGLAFLDNHYHIPGLMLPGYGTVNTLSTDMGTTESGTTYAGMGTGTASYISGQGLSSSVALAGGETTPFVVTLYDWLLADYAVEFWIAWDGGGAHCLTLYAIDLAEDSGGHITGDGTMSFIDPYGETLNDSSAGAVVVTDVAFITDSGGVMHIIGGYTAGAAIDPSDPDNTTHSATGMLINDLAEKPIGAALPEPSGFALFAAGMVALGRCGRTCGGRKPSWRAMRLTRRRIINRA